MNGGGDKEVEESSDDDSDTAPAPVARYGTYHGTV
jgi:hypothetical protein